VFYDKLIAHPCAWALGRCSDLLVRVLKAAKNVFGTVSTVLMSVNEPAAYNSQQPENRTTEAKHNSACSVLLLVPNLIGYVRFILTIYGLHLVTQKNSAGLHIYAFSSFLDAFDGYAARALNHGSVFGQLVDMTLDRTATVCLQLVIATLKPQLAMPMILLIMLDIISHWCHTSYAYMSQKHHKMIPARNLLMRIYYGNRIVLFFMCLANETYFLALAATLICKKSQVEFYEKLATILLPVCALRNLIIVFQLKEAMICLASLDVNSSPSPSARR